MTSAINIVVSCTNRKKFPSTHDLSLRSVHGTLTARADQWLGRLQTTEAASVDAASLYSGDHWSVARGLPEVAARAGLSASLWICSAGYGLIPHQAPLKSYAATFSAGHPDSVGGSADGSSRKSSRLWWQLLMSWPGPTPGAPRSLEQIAKAMPETPLLVVLSEPYLEAVVDDVIKAAAALTDPDLLLIISAGGNAIEGLEPHRIPCDARLQAHVGGAMRALNVRIARELLRETTRIPLRASSLKLHLGELLANQPALKAHNRSPLGDSEVRQFIVDSLKQNPSARHSPLLRQLRGRGKACEQSRFSTLFHEIWEETNGCR